MNNLLRRNKTLNLLGTAFLIVSLSACTDGGIESQIAERFPIEVEGCLCRHLDFEEDSFKGTSYQEMIDSCNQTIREGHPSLPEDIHSAPPIDSLRCSEIVTDWQKEVAAHNQEEQVNKVHFKEFLQPNSTDSED